MNYFTGTKIFEIREQRPIAVTLGKFDGIHRGHCRLLKHLSALKADGFASCVFTFDFRELGLIRKEPVRQLLTEEERREYLKRLGVDWMVEYPFDEETRDMDPETFVKEVLIERLHAGAVVVGTDFRFGRDRKGTPELLEELSSRFGYRLYVVEKEKDETGREISSTYIREELSLGRMKKVEDLLGYPYYLRGKVVHGLGLAGKLGFPTMNLIPNPEKMLPPYGVYCSRVELDGISYDGITNIGCKPTVSDQSTPWAETYLWDFEGDAYGKEICLKLYRHTRPEKSFASAQELICQMKSDVEEGKSFFEKVIKG